METAGEGECFGTGLTARQRKQVFMHSTIFDGESPHKNSVYGAKRQYELYDKVGNTLAKKEWEPNLHMPSPADLQCTQNAGHGVVMPSGSFTAKHIEANEPMTVMQASKKGDAIPKEFWATSVKLEWSDPRNEISRNKDGRKLDAATMKRHELSSQMFDTERNFDASTVSPKKELLAGTVGALKVDSSLDKHNYAKADPVGKNKLQQNRRQDNANSRYHRNLANSQFNTMKEPTDDHIPLESATAPVADDPDTLYRRRTEKNFSDLFGTKMGERKKIDNRMEVTGSKNCSFLDSRSEIARRNENKWRPDDDDKAEGSRGGGDTVSKSREEMLADHERVCWDTRSIMDSGSEIARRSRLKAFDDDPSRAAQHRKREDLSSSQVKEGLGAPQTPPHSPRVAGMRSNRGPAKSGIQQVSAKETKMAFLQSSIFG